MPSASSVALTSLSAIVRAEQPRDALAAQRHFERAAAVRLRSCDDVRRARLAAGDLEQQLRGALDGALLVRRIHAALEALPGIGDQPIAPAAAGDRGRREERRFEQHVDGRRRCTAVRAPPMTPAMPTGPSASAITSTSVVSSISLPSSSVMRLAGLRAAAPRGRP